jgi:hypothetical protein
LNDPHTEAAAQVDRLLGRARRKRLSGADCQALVEHVGLVPGRLGTVAHALSAQRDSAAVDALLQLPPHVPGVVEGLHAAMLAGVTRRFAHAPEGQTFFALDFRRSRSRMFGELLRRAEQVFESDFERLDVAGRAHYRVSVRQGRGTFAGRVAAKSQDIQWLHGRLGRWKSTRLWLNGWCFPVDGPWRAPIQVHLVRAWLSWAAGRTETLR